MKKIILIMISAITAFTLSACRDTPEYENVVYVTLYPMQFLVEEIAGDTVHVEYVPGASSHGASFDPGAKEIIDMMESDLLFYVNGGADSYIESNVTLFDGGNVELVDMSEHITYNEICLTHDHDHEDEEDPDTPEVCDENSLSPDPHFWLDPVKMITAAEFVKTKLISTFPDNTELYNNNWTALNAGLQKLNDDYQMMADNAVKPIMTTVRLFTYWEERYEIEILTITNDIHSSEGTIGDYTELLEEAVLHNIYFVAFEKNANSPEGDLFLSALETRYAELSWETPTQQYLHGLGKITTEEIENGSNYISIMFDNLEVLKVITK